MQIMNCSRTGILSGMMSGLLFLALTPSVFAQIVPPFAPGSLFSAGGPVVRITSPANAATFYAPVDIPLFAFAHDGVDALAIYDRVEFYASNAVQTIDLGPGQRLSEPPAAGSPITRYLIGPNPRLGAVYCLVWTNAPVGTYALRAVAGGTESGGVNPLLGTSLSRTSAPVNITILASATNNNVPDVVSVTATDPVAIAGTNACWIWPGLTNATPAWTNWPPAHWGSFTNWGPKNGLFTVRRFGDASSNLTVNYTVAGTAVSNVDYLGLPGSVTIPAGKAWALIPVVPLDKSVTNFCGTVVLSLKSDTNLPPDYTIGFPQRAAVLILDYWPRPLPPLLSDRSFHFNTYGPDGAWFDAQYSGDLLNWTSAATNQVVHGSIDYVDPDAPGNAFRFYRCVPLTNTPAD